MAKHKPRKGPKPARDSVDESVFSDASQSNDDDAHQIQSNQAGCSSNSEFIPKLIMFVKNKQM